MGTLSVEAYKKDGSFYQGVAKASTGFKLLEAMGWKEGDGLVRAEGKSEDQRARRADSWLDCAC